VPVAGSENLSLARAGVSGLCAFDRGNKMSEEGLEEPANGQESVGDQERVSSSLFDLMGLLTRTGETGFLILQRAWIAMSRRN